MCKTLATCQPSYLYNLLQVHHKLSTLQAGNFSSYHICLLISAGVPLATALLQHITPFLPLFKNCSSLYGFKCHLKSHLTAQLTNSLTYPIWLHGDCPCLRSSKLDYYYYYYHRYHLNWTHCQVQFGSDKTSNLNSHLETRNTLSAKQNTRSTSLYSNHTNNVRYHFTHRSSGHVSLSIRQIISASFTTYTRVLTEIITLL